MRLKLLLSLFGCLSISNIVHASETCAASLVSAFDYQLQLILKDQDSKLKTEIQQIKINKNIYITSKFLGRGGINNVYLSTLPDGTSVVIKQRSLHFYDQQDFVDLGQLYEQLATDYLLSKNIMVPKIRGFDPRSGVLVKDYIRGITSASLMNRLGEIIEKIQALPQPWQEELITPQTAETRNRLIADKRAIEEILNDLRGEIKKLQEAHKGFKAFINSRITFSMGPLELSQQYLEQGDYKQGDFVYDITNHKWVLIDP